VRLWLALLLTLALSSAPSSRASAQADAVKQALELGYEGDRLYAQGSWAEAYQRFADADALAHSPVFVLYMARCRKNAGRLLEARALYDRVMTEPVPTSAPQPFREAREDARAERGELDRRIVSVRVRVRGADGAPAALTIDGKPLGAGEGATPLDPGAHALVARSGGRVARRTVNLAEGSGTTLVELDLAAGGAPAPVADHEPGSLTPAWVALGVGLVGLVAGSVTGGIAAVKAGDVKEGCQGNHCRQQDAGDLDTAQTLATASTIAFAVGGVGLAAAGVLFVVRPGGGAPAAPSATPSQAWVGVSGAF
jgi:hypothetical protein